MIRGNAFRVTHCLAIYSIFLSGANLLAQKSSLAESTAEAEAANSLQASGTVFHDANRNGRYDPPEQRLAGIKVSNGREIVATDAKGRYTIPIDDDSIVFIIKPRGWATPLNQHNLPRFYYIHKPAGSPEQRYAGVAPTGPLPESIDFALYQQEEPDQFRALMFGDTQSRNKTEVGYMTHDIIEQVIAENAHEASLGVTLGDIVFDDLDVFEPHNQAIALIGIPWYNVIGNHDLNFDAASDELSDETFESHYGPSYYSFDYGPVHFMVLDDVMWHAAEEGKRAHFTGGLGERQMAFIRNDLERIPENQLVVLMMHIPLVNVEDREELYRMIEKRPFAISISAHTHYVKHYFLDQQDGWQGEQPHHHIVNVTVCGSWWRGAPDELGIPHATMSDGGPNGYSILTFNGHEYDLEFHAARRPADHQMNIYLPKEIRQAEAMTSVVIANVFNGSERTQVRFRVLPDGPWTDMQRFEGIAPYFAQLKAIEASLDEPLGLTLPGPSVTNHLWRAMLPPTLPAGTHVLEVEATDMHGKKYVDRETLRVLPQPMRNP
ncbi:MAG: calcineurin-like phosphoesterase family protein [bacterium]|nr:calcineurin-like phosphoesterase family protein [bacterium]